MLIILFAFVSGIILLVWSAEWFVTGSAAIARCMGLSPLIIGMVIVGFGTSAPELLVSGLAAVQGNSGLALGNAYGSNITNIALILGLTALIRPIVVRSKILHQELPILTGITFLASIQLLDGELTRLDSLILLVLFLGLMLWTLYQSNRHREDALGEEFEHGLRLNHNSTRSAVIRLVVGLIVLIASSRLLVWSAIEVAQRLGISDLIIGLTIIATGTSLPELASSLIAAHRREDDIALGNVLGSNLFNTLAVVGTAGMIRPMHVNPEILHRDYVLMMILTISLFVIGYRPGGHGRINRYEGILLLGVYTGYITWLVVLVLHGSQ